MKFFEPIIDKVKILGEILNFQLFELNKTPVTILSIVMFLVMVFIFFIISRIFNRLILKSILARFDIEKGIRFNLLRISHYLIMVSGVVIGFQFVGINLGGLAVIFGLLSVGIGFGLQNVTSNFVAGLILLFERPIKVGDRVTVGEVDGDVISINMRSTTVRSLNNIAIIVPNSEFISSKVTNWSYGDPKIRLDVAVGVSYSSDIDLVIRALTEVAREHPDILKIPEPTVLLKEFGDSSWNMLLRVWLGSTRRYYKIKSELNIGIVRKFHDYGVEIPFPQRDLHVRSPLPLPLKQESIAGEVN
jgi:small-conductance mechanosensitive channel